MANYNTYTEEPYVLMNSEGYAATRGDHIQEQTANWEMGAVDPSQQAYSYFQQTGSWPGQEVSVYRQVPQVSQPFPHPHRRVLSDDAVTHFPQADQLPVEQSSMFPYPRTEQGSSSPVASQWTTTAPFPNVDQSAPSPQSSPPSPQSIPSPSASTDSIKDSVKVEPEDAGCFIMEGPPQPTQSALVPPMEVPLRATQAPHEMRHMMNAFRINPFTMHSGEGRGVAQPSTQEPGPLESEPIILEFQLDVPTSESPKEESGSFTLAEDMRRTDWDDDRDDDRSDPDFGQPVSWGNGFSADGDPFAHTQPVVTDFTPRNASRMLATCTL
ncbi:hypothetical protein BDN72DRAFT_894809 [Pluteus cervinus]|uniref:Uncharacterized protein n=1 Tax=Pluteus cervinus TaxID=181527 RepID=A0ACD3B4A6_9AGAR|nr:hypothetical protein BDN72DRAFT_894809 [Pluteus cervinus]